MPSARRRSTADQPAAYLTAASTLILALAWRPVGSITGRLIFDKIDPKLRDMGWRQPRSVLGHSWSLLVAMCVLAGCSAVHSANAPTRTIETGTKVVSYHGVQVVVPVSWPTVDGMHSGICDGPFPATPTAFLGPQLQVGASCVFNGPPPHRDGVWLLAGPKPTKDVAPFRTPSGQRLLQAQPAPSGSATLNWFWYHGVTVEIGIGPDPKVGTAILDSVRFAPHAPDTPAAAKCSLSQNPLAMPAPERLPMSMTLNGGGVTLEPPPASAQPIVSAAKVWNETSVKYSFERPSLLLALYSAKLPARVDANGSLVPVNQDVLSWVVYSVPRSQNLPGCGEWGVDVWDATTGQHVITRGWSPGP